MTPLASSTAVTSEQPGAKATALTSLSNEVSARFVATSEPVSRPNRELLRREDGTTGFANYSNNGEYASSSNELLEKLKLLSRPMRGMLLPTSTQVYGTTELLFDSVKHTIAEQTHLAEHNCALLAFWVFSTWFQDANPILPALLITGSAFAGDIVLRCLKALSYHSLLLAGINIPDLNVIPWDESPTLIISKPNFGKKLDTIVGCTASRGYSLISGNHTLDYFGSKALYLGEGLPSGSLPLHSIHLDATILPLVNPGPNRRLSEETFQSLQNQLLEYRIRNRTIVNNSEFSPAGLALESGVIASVLGNCIVNAPSLEEYLVSILAPQAQQQMADRLGSIEGLTVEAAFLKCHQEETEVMVKEITAEVNRMLIERGEKLQYSPESVGHTLKKVGLFTQRLGRQGNGLRMNEGTRLRIHKVASFYRDLDSPPSTRPAQSARQ
jgi:hypothetical protein